MKPVKPMRLRSCLVLCAISAACSPEMERYPDDRVTSPDGLERWEQFKTRISPGTAEFISRNFHLARKAPTTLIWCDYITAPTSQQVDELRNFFKEQLPYWESHDELKASEIKQTLIKYEQEWKEKTLEIVAKDECLAAYGIIPERRLLPGRRVKT